jgi:hypothetical protein
MPTTAKFYWNPSSENNSTNTLVIASGNKIFEGFALETKNSLLTIGPENRFVRSNILINVVCAEKDMLAPFILDALPAKTFIVNVPGGLAYFLHIDADDLPARGLSNALHGAMEGSLSRVLVWAQDETVESNILAIHLPDGNRLCIEMGENLPHLPWRLIENSPLGQQRVVFMSYSKPEKQYTANESQAGIPILLRIWPKYNLPTQLSESVLRDHGMFEDSVCVYCPRPLP